MLTGNPIAKGVLMILMERSEFVHHEGKQTHLSSIFFPPEPQLVYN